MTYATLPTYHFTHGATITQAQPPQPGTVTLNSPALSVMTDLVTVRAATIHPHMSLSQAEAEMMHQGVRLLFVVKELAWVDGVVTLTDLLGDRPLMLVHQRNMKHHDITVADVMTRLGDLDAIDEESLVVYEHSSRTPAPADPAFRLQRSAVYGEVALAFLHPEPA